jgi:hypothetical protein
MHPKAEEKTILDAYRCAATQKETEKSRSTSLRLLFTQNLSDYG